MKNILNIALLKEKKKKENNSQKNSQHISH